MHDFVLCRVHVLTVGFVIRCKYLICHHLIDVHLYKFFTCLDINKTCLNHIEHAATPAGKLILIGDFNVHWDFEEDSEHLEQATLLNDYDLVQHVKGPTHERGHTLDLVITRQEDDLVASCDIGAFISDHNSLHVTLNLLQNTPTQKNHHISQCELCKCVITWK